jgi:ribonuclease R
LPSIDSDILGLDLGLLAESAMVENGFELHLPADAARELASLGVADLAAAGAGARDLRHLLWSSIDNTESRDLDQIEYAERLPDGTIRVLIGIADVDALVPRSSALDRHAFANTTSVYTGVTVFPMLPEAISTGLTSLLDREDRLAVVGELDVGADGVPVARAFYRAWVRNQAKLSYDVVGEWLESGGPPPAAVARVPGLEAQIRLQVEASERLRAERKRNGALDFETIEARPVVENGKIVDLVVPRKNPARTLIENLMIGANVAMARLLTERGVPCIQRIVREPSRWPRIVELAAELGESLPEEPDPVALSELLSRRKQADPERFPDLSLSVVKLLGPGDYAVVGAGGPMGHFGLAAQYYTHSTAPNRRYTDLVTQRLIKAVIAGAAPPYAPEELEAVADRCNERESAARKVERRLRKTAAAFLLGHRIGDVFDAIVTGVVSKGTFVRLVAPPAEGRVVRGEAGMQVGDRVRVRLLDVKPRRGFIDFQGLGPAR